MEDLFHSISKRLTFDDLSILSILYDYDIDSRFKAFKKRDLRNEVVKRRVKEQGSGDFTEANFRKSIYRLEAVRFIEIVYGEKEHKIYMTKYGLSAIRQSLKGVG
ncbi:hypothetical protein [Chengkuizengella marina]|uniref:Uncharacterized protein n=1 Tax=Chengkuizengella marina TaxID=2507566 RepID=A0A6N9Q0Y9_9BACL|nr:hypothetical protein [Chengkuizengella marina]NBI28615.1 hypothetical protein [Chengkuizengella marina]